MEASPVIAPPRPTPWAVRLARFLCVGASGVGVNLGIIALLVELVRVMPKYAAVPAFAAAMTWNYAWNRRWTFEARDAPLVGSYLKYATGTLIGLALQVGTMHLLQSWHYAPAALAGIGAGTAFNFAASSLWAFSERT